MVRRLILSTCVIAMIASGVGFAATTGRMGGAVLDNDGLALPGVTVTTSSDRLIGGPQMAITGADGGFVFNLLPPGMYRVEANLPGFQPAAAEVRVSLDRMANVTFNMVPEQFGGEIEVTADVPVVDTAQVNTSVVFDQDYLQRAAVGASGRDYLSIIGQAAGVAGSGNASVMGSTNSDNSYLVDGLNTTDPSFGTFGTNFNYDAIQEMSFQTGGYEAEFGQATGGIINLVTKSGGNEFSGSLDIRYRNEGMIENGDHFDRDDQTSSSENYSATFGGPILRDRLWFFLSGEFIDNKFKGEGYNSTRNYKGMNYIAKATWQASDANRVVFKFSGDPAEIPGRNASPFVAETGDLTTEQGGNHYQLEWNSVLSESMLLNMSLGHAPVWTAGKPTHGDLNQEGHYNEDELITYYYGWTWDLPRGRDQIDLAMTFFADDFAGSHEFKGGVEYTELFEEDVTYLTGGGRLWDIQQPQGSNFEDTNGDGFFNHYIQRKEPEALSQEQLNSDGKTMTFYIQDAWRPIGNLTIKPGVRMDNVKTYNHPGEKIADMDRWQPRLGVAWDLFGDAKHVVRGSWGRFMDPTALSIAGFARGVNIQYAEYNTLEYYCNTIHICDAAFLESIFGPAEVWTNWRGITYTLFDNRGIDTYEPAMTVDQAGYGTLKAPYAESLILAYETQIASETSLEVTYVDKTTTEMIEDTCSNNHWAWDSTVPYPTLDDQSTWTTGADCSGYIVANVPGFERNYEAIIVKAETRRENFHLMGSITNSESTGNTANGADDTYATELADFYALHFFNREGYLPDHREWRVKASGYWLLPYDFTIGFDGWWESAGHLSPSSLCDNYVNARPEVRDYYGYDESMTQYCFSGDGFSLSSGSDDIYLEPRGSFESESRWQMDFQVSKAFHVGKVDMTAILSIYNLFSVEGQRYANSTAFRSASQQRIDDVETGVDPNALDAYEAVYAENGSLLGYYMPIGQTTTYYSPRRYELGFRIEF